MDGLEAAGQLLKVAALAQQAPLDLFAQLRRNLRHPARAGKNAFGQYLRRRARRGGAEVRHKIADGKINFVADRRNHRQGGMEDGAGHGFLVEGPQVFQAAAAAGDEDQVQRRGGFLRPLVEQPDGRRDFRRRARALHRAWRQNYFHRRVAPPHHLQNIAEGRAGGGGDQADALRKAGQGPFSFGREKPFGAELLLEFFKGGLERADALQFHGQHLYLILSARLIDGDVALENHLPSIGQRAALATASPRKKTQLNCAPASLRVK